MSDSKFTPGPWEVCNLTDVFTPTGAANRGGVEAASNDGWHVADCAVGATTNAAGEECFLFFDEQKANANLIAAAPELLEALEDILDQSAYTEVIGMIDFENAYKAIAKAKGEQL